jgi:hypothetical protein
MTNHMVTSCAHKHNEKQVAGHDLGGRTNLKASFRELKFDF